MESPTTTASCSSSSSDDSSYLRAPGPRDRMRLMRYLDANRDRFEGRSDKQSQLFKLAESWIEQFGGDQDGSLNKIKEHYGRAL